jgi:DNA polymerase III sliding clamp (beta) subunit (PCNA family)
VTVFAIGATDLADALANVLPHADNNGMLPILGAVRVEVEAAGLVTFVATDRYTLAMQVKLALPDTDIIPGAFAVARTDVVDLVKMAKAAKLGAVTLAHDGACSLTVTAPGTSTTRQTVDGEFPKYRSLLPDGDPVPTAVIGLAPANLAKFAKLQQGGRSNKHAALVCTFRGATKPVEVTVSGLDGFRAIVMPVRLSETAA